MHGAVGLYHFETLVVSAAVRQDRYYEMGCLLALSMLHGGPPPSFFSKALYFSLFHFPKDFQFSISDLNETWLAERLKKVILVLCKEMLVVLWFSHNHILTLLRQMNGLV